jgi:hypothetical protein
MVNTDNGTLGGNGVEHGSVPDIFGEIFCGFTHPVHKNIRTLY